MSRRPPRSLSSRFCSMARRIASSASAWLGRPVFFHSADCACTASRATGRGFAGCRAHGQGGHAIGIGLGGIRRRASNPGWRPRGGVARRVRTSAGERAEQQQQPTDPAPPPTPGAVPLRRASPGNVAPDKRSVHSLFASRKPTRLSRRSSPGASIRRFARQVTARRRLFTGIPARVHE